MKKQTYASITDSDGVNYREIADTMTEIGFKMNHSSARNYVLRIMSKFAEELVEQWDLDVPDSDVERISKSPQFQQGICDVLQAIESQRTKTKSGMRK
jgi:hypothetical protein